MQFSIKHTEVYVTDFENEDQERMIADLLRSLHPIFPRWMAELFVYYDVNPTNEGSRASVNVNPEYLRFTIWIYPTFFGDNKTLVRRSLIHELYHCIQGPVLSFVRGDVMDYVNEHNEPLSVAWKNEFTGRIETITQEQTRIIDTLLTRISKLEKSLDLVEKLDKRMDVLEPLLNPVKAPAQSAPNNGT